ncbi:MAG: DNA polymerase III subunit epsilon [Gammaproteobacteria bacterium]|nr:DNA polymerase III subunit epsilon [Gammaproteobacteria bacterium]MBU1725900.1 DNA polymerase III subunit epsilon [Gammaproteobacteria bacterium]MBU2006394.1 DNA polymerase III subunit epsilon [Gammaproteobacteria bacterium]
MRRFDKRVAIGVVIIGIVCLAWLLVTGALIGAALTESERAAVINAVGARAVLLVLMWAVSLVLVGSMLSRLVAYFMTAPARLAEEAQVLLGTDVKRQLEPTGSVENRRLTELFNQLVQQREALREEMDERVAEAAHNTEQEKNRLAALMSELTKSVVVCNLDGRILLYNNRARMQFRALSQAPGSIGGTELIGLGRSVYGVFDRKLVAHALENIQHRLQRGAAAPSAQFITTTPSGQLLRAQMAPVRSVQDNSEASQMTGFVLMLDNITREFEAQARQDSILHTLTERSRAALANMQAALDVLEYPDIEPDMHDRLLKVLREETAGLGNRLREIKSSSVDSLVLRWPLEDMLGADLAAAAIRRIESLGTLTAVADDLDDSLWLKVESFSLLQALSYLAERLRQECTITTVQLRLKRVDGRGQLDLCWQPSANKLTDKVIPGWETDPMRSAGEDTSLTIQDVVERHGGAFWFGREPENGTVFFRFLLPLAAPQEQLETASVVRNESRPEYYDFDLFQTSAQTRSLEDSKLSELSFTVFDTETTGLDPANGDEIIQLAAVRIVNGKLLRQESFDQLVDPRRAIPRITIPIHGITPEMVKGQPTIDKVLPAFHQFAQDTVLVAHNAAFDMRCLQVKEKLTGLVFDHPVMDTLLLSAVVHPNQESHRLEAITERFNINILGRHTALGDAMATAEVFLRLIPLLAEKGIHTLGQAREAAQKTYYARLKY